MNLVFAAQEKNINIVMGLYKLLNKDDIVFEPFKGDGSFYNVMPNTHVKKYAEIDEGIDAFTFKEKYTAILTNPPYSLINKTSKVLYFKLAQIKYAKLDPILDFKEKNNESRNSFIS